MKKCSHCKITKLLDEFYNNKTTEDNKTHQCKQCYKEYRETHKEYTREYLKKEKKG